MARKGNSAVLVTVIYRNRVPECFVVILYGRHLKAPASGVALMLELQYGIVYDRWKYVPGAGGARARSRGTCATYQKLWLNL